MNQPEVTIGICFRNPTVEYFSLALRSVFAQTFTDWELLLVNDISTDGSLEIAQRLLDQRVRLVNDGLGKSLSVRLNEMVRLARGKFFVRMDADDAMAPERLERQVRELRASSTDTVVGSFTYSLDGASRVVGGRNGQPQRQGYGALHSFHHPTVAAHTQWFLANPYSERYHRAEDAELWCRTTGHSRFVVLEERLLFYREGASSLTAYLQTQVALITLLRERFFDPRWRYLLLLLREVVKLLGISVCDALGLTHLAINQRYAPIAESEVRRATALLEAVSHAKLPMLNTAAFGKAVGHSEPRGSGAEPKRDFQEIGR